MRNIFTFFLVLCLLYSSGHLLAQSEKISVRGKVVDSLDGKGIPGVSILEKGSTNGTQSDSEGNYSITVAGNATLIFSYVSYRSQEVAVRGQNQLNISLSQINEQLDQVVVIGYGTAAKRDLTGSIVQVKGEDIVDRPGTNPVANLQGKVAGLQVTNSGRPGQEPDIRIRGTNSINNIRPLYVVDGILNDNINFLNPNDIENIEVLKDPSSLAVFGVRGANGVIAVTTKKAKSGELRFDFSSRVGIKNVPDRMRMTNADEFRLLYDEQRANEGLEPFNYSNWQANTNWQDEIFGTGMLNYNNLSVSGATDKNTFRLGIGNMLEEGVISHEKHSQFTFNIHDELRLTNNIRVGMNFNGYRSELPQNRDVFTAIRAAPIAPVFNQEYGLYHTMPGFQRAQVFNPLVDIEERRNTFIGREYRAVGSIYGEVDFLKDFTFRTAFYADYGFNQNRSYTPLVSVFNPDIEGDNKAERIGALVTRVDQTQNKYYKYQSDWILTYRKTIGKHSINPSAGFTTYQTGFESVSAARTAGSGLQIPNDPDYWFVGIGDVATQTGTGSAWENRTSSFFVRALYNYDGKYLLNATYRRDGSSAFTRAETPWQDFYTLGGAWVASSESFMQDLESINLLKIKGSWGRLGNQNTGGNVYPMYPLLVEGNSAVFGDQVVPALQPEYIPEPNLRWEVQDKWEAGFELSMFNNRFRFESVYYSNETDGLLVSIPGISGSIPGLGNLGNISNSGIELSTSWQQRVTDDFSFSFGGNITTVRNRVNSLSTDGYQVISGPSRTTAGYPIAYFWGLEHDGIFQTAEEIRLSPTNGLGGGDFMPGDIKYKDVNGDGVITVDDRTMIGNPTPDFYYGINLGLTYKNFDLGVEFNGVYGNEIFRSWNQNTFAQFNFQAERLERWTGIGTSNWEPIMNSSRPMNREISSYFIEDGSFFRLRDVTLGYRFSPQLIQRMRLKGLRVFANAQNVFTLANNTGFTPEIGGGPVSFGVDGGTYPVPAIYTFGLNLNF